MWLSKGLAALLSIVAAQGAADAQLPSAPSAVQQERQKPKPPAEVTAPAPNQQSSAPPTREPASSGSEPALPHPKGSEPDESVATFRTRVDEVSLVFTVTDKRGRFVKDLVKDDFKILDDNKPPRAVVSFRSESDLPLRIGLLIDASTSVRDRFRFEQEAAVQFLSQNIRYRYDQAFVLGFDSTYKVTQDFTDDTEKLTKGVRVLRPGGGTALYDAFYFACRDKLLKGSQERRQARRAIILLSDGDDNVSHVSREEAIDMAQRAEVIVYAISTNVSGQKGRGDKVLKRMADATGGRVFFPFQIEDVADAFADIQDELRSQYALAYRPADFRRDGRYRTVNVIAQNRKDLRVRARPGYYAPQE